jgi:hypothetical protein
MPSATAYNGPATFCCVVFRNLSQVKCSEWQSQKPDPLRALPHSARLMSSRLTTRGLLMVPLSCRDAYKI